MAALFYGLAAANNTPDTVVIQATTPGLLYEFSISNTSTTDGAGTRIKKPDTVRASQKIREYIARLQTITAFTGIGLGDLVEQIATGGVSTGKLYELKADVPGGVFAALKALSTLRVAIQKNGEQW
jgi:hypothetical protein